MKNFDQFIQYKVLGFKFAGLNSADNIAKAAKHEDGTPVTLDEIYASQGIELKNVCAKLSSQLVERMDNTLGILGMTKREFIELALIEALERVDIVLDETDAFEYHYKDRGEE